MNGKLFAKHEDKQSFSCRMKKITDWIKKNYLMLLPVLLLLIFIVSIWDRNFYIGGDIVLPLNPQSNIEKSMYVWELENQGVSGWRYMLLLWQLPFYFFSLLGIPPFIGIKIFITGIMVIGFVSTYFFFRTLFKESKYDRKNLAFFCGFIFILSASTVLILPTVIFLSALPLCSYFVIKYLDTGKFWYLIFFSIIMNQAYLAQLPQAKYLFILLGVLFFVLLLYKQLRGMSVKKIVFKLIIFSVFTLLLNAFILIPFLHEAFKTGGTYSYYTQNVTVYNGEADLHFASLPYITRFFNSNLLNDVSSLGRFLGSPLFILWTFFLWMISLLAAFFVKNRKEKRIIYLLFLGLISFIFLAKGANPPFGEIYKFLLFNLPIFKIFRTTADTVIGGILFFAILVTIVISYLIKERQRIFPLILFIHIVIFSPIYLGYRLITSEEKGQIKKGFFIPNEYYQMGKRLDTMKEDMKILSLPLDNSYSYKDWQYIGISIMAWMTKKPFIHGQVAGFPDFADNLVLQRMTTKESCYWTAIHNIGYILNEKDSRIIDYSLSGFNFSLSTVLENSYFKLEKVNPECFLPHIYAATDVFLFKGENNSIPDVSRFIKNKQDIVVGLDNPFNHDLSLESTSQIIEAYPKETSNLNDNLIVKKVFNDLSNLDPLNFWTYSFNAPTDGNYQMVIDDQGQISKESKFLKEGNNSVKIPILKSKNLIDDSLLINDQQTKNFSQALENLEGDGLYLFSLKYTANTTSNILLSGVERERYFVGRLPFYELNVDLFVAQIKHQEPGTYEYQALLRTDNNAQTLNVTLKKLFEEMTIESFKIEKVTPPKVFFTRLKDKQGIIPEISFEKINPTKYLVKVKNATNPYHLVFSESFSPDWKASILQRPIAENQHLIVNGFANGWKITPKDSQGETNYTIVIEYWPQRLFYLGGVISILAAVFCISRSLKRLKKPC